MPIRGDRDRLRHPLLAHRHKRDHDGQMSAESIPVLRVSDPTRSLIWYGRLGYSKEWEYRYDESTPVFMSVTREGSARLFLSEYVGDANLPTLVYLQGLDLVAVAAEFDCPVVDEPWGLEVHLYDPDGNRLRLRSQRSAT
jgi:hypothetical protein